MARRNRDHRQKPMDFMLPSSEWKHPSSLPDLRCSDLIAVDLETRDDGLANGRGSGWVYGAGHIAGVAVASSAGQVYAPVTHPDGPVFGVEETRDWLLRHLTCGARIVFHNSPYDLGWLFTEWGVNPDSVPLDDTQIMSYLLDENRMTYALDDVCGSYQIDGKDETLLRDAAEALGCDPKAELWRMPARYVGPYAEQDAVATLELARLLRGKMEAQNLNDAYQLECDLIPMIIRMRHRGVRIDTAKADEVKHQLLERRDAALVNLTDRLNIGRAITIQDVLSPRFLAAIFKEENLPYTTTAKGNPSFKTDEIDKIDHWMPELITIARKAHDAGDKFVGNYIQNFTHLGRIHSEARSTKTRTTRFAYSDPPLQQMPSRDPVVSGLIRGLFLPEEGEVWGALDYSQQEFRLMVHFAKLCGMAGVDEAVERYRADPNTDFHNLAADLTKLPRRKAKDVNFAKAFGAGKAKFALMTGMTLEEAVEAMDQYDELLPFISRLSGFCQKRADSRGYIRLLDGARSHFDRWEPRWLEWEKVAEVRALGHDPKLNPTEIREARDRVADPDHPWSGRLRRAMTHKAMNSLIQGSAARQTKLCMRAIYRAGILPLLQMHDELDFSFRRAGEAAEAQRLMVETVSLEVPVVVDAEFGPTWGTAKVSEGYGATFDEAMERIAA